VRPYPFPPETQSQRGLSRQTFPPIFSMQQGPLFFFPSLDVEPVSFPLFSPTCSLAESSGPRKGQGAAKRLFFFLVEDVIFPTTGGSRSVEDRNWSPSHRQKKFLSFFFLPRAQEAHHFSLQVRTFPALRDPLSQWKLRLTPVTKGPIYRGTLKELPFFIYVKN